MTPTQRDSVPAKSPVTGGDPVGSHSPFDPHHRPDVYRGHLLPHLDPTMAFHRVLDPGTVFKAFSFFPLSPCKKLMKTLIPTELTKAAQASCFIGITCPGSFFSCWRQQWWSVSLSRLFIGLFFLFVLFLSPAAAFMFPRQPSPTGYHNTYQLYTIENTRQTIMNDYITSQQMQGIPRPDMARGLSPREQPVAIPYAPGSRGMALRWLTNSHLPQQAGERLWAGGVVQ